jgi:uncharacterized membrane protein
MTVSTVVFLLLRVVHVLLAAVWIGMTAFVTLLLMPTIKEPGGMAGGPLAQAMMRRGLHIYMASLGGIVVLTGFYLYWRFTGGFDPVLSGTRGAMVFGTGGILGTLALILGGAMVGRNAKKMAAATSPSEFEAARDKTTTWGRIVLVLQLSAIAAMALGHYV